MRLEVLVGPIASGKSSYARLRASEGALIVCHDDLTAMLHGEHRDEPGLRECYRRMEESIAWAALSSGRDVVVDRDHLTRESRARWIAWARMYDSLHWSGSLGPTTPVFAVAFPAASPEAHARRRFVADPRGRPYEEWLAVAEHHHARSLAEPLSAAEGFAEILDPEEAR